MFTTALRDGVVIHRDIGFRPPVWPVFLSI
jgi:hypothetical protein